MKFWEEYVLRGNAAILKCQIPSFVSEYVSVNSWIISNDDKEEEIKLDSTSNLGWSLFSNLSHILNFPLHSYLFISQEKIIFNHCSFYKDLSVCLLHLNHIVSVVSQAYAVNLMEEYVLRGNSAILKCHIPSFVSEYVSVNSWIISEDSKDIEIKLESAHNYDGMKTLPNVKARLLNLIFMLP